MKSKTWNIGEYAKGGVITVEVDKDVISIIGKDWDFSVGSSRESDQSNAVEFTRLVVNWHIRKAEMRLYMFLTELTISYYADEIIKWVKNVVV